MDPKVSEMAKRLRENQKRNQNDFERQSNKHKKRLERLHEIELNMKEVKRNRHFS